MEAKPERVKYKNLLELIDKTPMKKGTKAALMLFVPGLLLFKLRNKWRKMKARLEEYINEDIVTEEVQEEEPVKKNIDTEKKTSDNVQKDPVKSTETHSVDNAVTEKVQEKKEPAVKNMNAEKKTTDNVQKEQVKSTEDYSFNNAAASLDYSKSKTEQLKQKQVKVTSKGLGIFALSAKAVKKLASQKFHKIKEIIEAHKKVRADKKATRSAEKAERSKARETQRSEIAILLKGIYEELKTQNQLKREELNLMYGRALTEQGPQVAPTK